MIRGEMATLLELRGAGRRPALPGTHREGAEGPWLWRDLDLTLTAGERVAVAGPSGAGKTLLLRTLAALDPLQEGTLHLQGRPLGAWSTPEFRAAVLYVPQSAGLQEGTVEENLRLPFSFQVHRKAGRAYVREEARGLLAELGREDLLDRYTPDLSGGERQVVALVRALLLTPTVLLLDEPTASMDEALTLGAEALVEGWRTGAERAVLWTSHRADQLARVTDRRVALTPNPSPKGRGASGNDSRSGFSS